MEIVDLTGSDSDEDNNMPPPASQSSHFTKFENFTPQENAPFKQEFARLASSQEWEPGTKEYTRQRTIAMREELNTHYFPSSQPPRALDAIPEAHDSDDDDDDKAVIPPPSSQPAELTDEEILQGFQDLCAEVGIARGPSTDECKRTLKGTLVNIVDLIDARRVPGTKVQVWDDFEAFRRYTLHPDNRISLDEAKAPPGFLASLLQVIRTPGAKMERSTRDQYSGWNLDLRWASQIDEPHGNAYPVGIYYNCPGAESKILLVPEIAIMIVMDRLTDKHD
ncbi:hypothetical protein B0T25DRAFT_583126 [Lasiosphaeria hispida]|uniref:DUF4246 domain-containing protein n=1 Tax=Lasiosphaeria hispida TaxID=260671 RepID=A0AAJ0HAL5_9PEZI|nr:hypothetical protein B0T25DRAFT_583126 [Lasiosphaeria hispida]